MHDETLLSSTPISPSNSPPYKPHSSHLPIKPPTLQVYPKTSLKVLLLCLPSIHYSIILCICFLMASSSEDPLVAARVIGDVVGPFVPTVDLSVSFGTDSVSTDCDIKPFKCMYPPLIIFNGLPDQLYTLIMTHPDAPDPNDPSEREWIHWIVSDIRAGYDPTMGNEVLPYVRPRPKVGIHRYVLVLFKQERPLIRLAPPSYRDGFSTRSFSEMNDLGLPVAAVYFRSQNMHVKKRSKASGSQSPGSPGTE